MVHLWIGIIMTNKTLNIDNLKIKEGYCECGCHCNEITCGPFYYSVYQHINENRKIDKVYVMETHGPCSKELGVFYTYKQAFDFCRKDIIKRVKEMFK